jgi:hypothetical protein
MKLKHIGLRGELVVFPLDVTKFVFVHMKCNLKTVTFGDYRPMLLSLWKNGDAEVDKKRIYF